MQHLDYTVHDREISVAQHHDSITMQTAKHLTIWSSEHGKGVQDGCVTAHCYHEDQVASFEMPEGKRA